VFKIGCTEDQGLKGQRVKSRVGFLESGQLALCPPARGSDGHAVSFHRGSRVKPWPLLILVFFEPSRTCVETTIVQPQNH